MHAADFRAQVSTGKPPVTDRAVRVPRPRPGVWQRMVKYRLLYLLFVPVAAYFVIFQYWPIVLSFIVAFKDLKLGRGIFRSEWVGLENFTEIFTDPPLLQVFSNTVEISLLRLVFGFFPPIILAVLLHDLSSRIFTKISQTIVYIPHFFSWIIVYGIVFALFSTGSGLINNVLAGLGQQRFDFLLSEDWFRPILIGAGVWKEIG